MNLKELKNCTKKELLKYLIMLEESFTGYAIIIEDYQGDDEQ